MLKKNKSIALVMILALLIITSSCAPKTHSRNINCKQHHLERKLCRSKLDIISSYGDDQAFHPKVLNFENHGTAIAIGWHTLHIQVQISEKKIHTSVSPMTGFIGSHLKEREKLFHLIH